MPRHVRDRLSRQSTTCGRSCSTRDSRASAAQGLSEAARAAARPVPERDADATRHAAEPGSARVRRRARRRGHRQHRPVASGDARNDPGDRRAGRRKGAPRRTSTAAICIAASRRSANRTPGRNLIPYVDRLNYCSGLINDFAYCEAVETLMDIEITPRCRYLRTLLSEYSRIADHLTCIAASLMELGAMTAFLYLVMIRDYIYEHLAALTGARVTYTYGRIGGLAQRPARWLACAAGRDPRSIRGFHRPDPRTDGPQPHLHRPHPQHRRDLVGGCGQLGIHRPDPAFDRRAARPAQGHALSRVRRARVRGARRNQRRQLRPVLRADARDGRVGAHDPTADGHAAGRSDQRRRPPLRAAAESIWSTARSSR